MKRPGGVGSMSRSVKAPGPDKDVFNTWTQKHIPGLNIEGPSMSIMGSETAKFGFKQESGIVESSYEEGREADASNRQGTGLDRAAAAVETWLRGALTKGPGGPLKSGRGATDFMGRDGVSDLIELTDTASDEGPVLPDSSVRGIDNLSLVTSGRNDTGARVRGRTIASSDKGGKAE